MQTFLGNPGQATPATGEGNVVNSGHLQGAEAIVAFPAMDKAAQTNPATLIQSDAQASVENLSSATAMQVRATSVSEAENDALLGAK
uniref:Uncharacterized protein n=1 Tax=uncultured Thiotrichaceae bacterium TaxID=298394 RepID=A0A6S6SCE3_9GAMM|nr:MAG: Unknown protein [uncultured Thiotrichaceae bacterium]